MKANKHKGLTVLLFSTVFLHLNGCGEISYKRGAGPADFQQEKETCLSDHKTDDEIDKCLEKNGWIIVGIDKPVITEAPNDTAESTTSESKESPEQATLDPLEKITTGSWWKAGASPESLMADSKACVAELGDAHQTANNMSLVTRGLISCMSDKGWYAQ
jgi:hypothetical protein